MKQVKPLERLVYCRRLIRNAVLCLLMALALWIAMDCPLPAEMAFRRAERQNLSERSEVVWKAGNGGRFGEWAIVVGRTADMIYTYSGPYFYRFPRREGGGTLVSVPDGICSEDEAGSYYGPAFLVPDPPEGAESARLTVTMNVNNWREDYTVKAELSDGVLFFPLARRYHLLPENPTPEETAQHNNEDAAFSVFDYSRPNRQKELPYTLTFFDGEGTALETIRQEGWLAETP